MSNAQWWVVALSPWMAMVVFVVGVIKMQRNVRRWPEARFQPLNDERLRAVAQADADLAAARDARRRVVTAAREAGRSWAAIAETLGTSRRAAQREFATW